MKDVSKFTHGQLIEVLRDYGTPFSDGLCASYDKGGYLSPRQEFYARKLVTEIISDREAQEAIETAKKRTKTQKVIDAIGKQR